MTPHAKAELSLLPQSLAVPVRQALIAKGFIHTPAETTTDRAIPRLLVVGTILPTRRSEHFLDTNDSQWWEVVESTLAAVFEQLQKVPLMAENGGGRVILVTDDLGISADAGRSVESTVGAAAIAMTKSLAREFGPRAVSANAVAVQADLLHSEDRCGGEYSDQVAQSVAFLADPDLSHLTGQIIPCNHATVRGRA
jgi:NAD(P)-dependent dehydrogenase (short-subunit alcohol dehydrogenase family)